MSEGNYLKQAFRVSMLPRVNIVRVLSPFIAGTPLKMHFYVKIPYIEDCKYKCRPNVNQMMGYDKLVLGSHYIECLMLKNSM